MSKAALWFGLVAGVNGAGKSTFSQNPDTLKELVQLSSTDLIEIINPDTITRAIQKEQPELPLPAANRLAADQVDQKVRERIELKQGSFVIETVLGSDKYKAIVERARELGWKILFVYVALPSIQESLRRVARRVAEGGHDVPEAKIRKRWPVSLANLPWFWTRADASYLFLNPPNYEATRLVAFRRNAHTTILLPDECPHAVGPLIEAATRERDT